MLPAVDVRVVIVIDVDAVAFRLRWIQRLQLDARRLWGRGHGGSLDRALPMRPSAVGNGIAQAEIQKTIDVVGG